MATNAATALVEQMELELMRDLPPIRSLEKAFGSLRSNAGESHNLCTSILSTVMTGTVFEPFQCYDELGRWLFTDIVVILAKFLQGVTFHRQKITELPPPDATNRDEKVKLPSVYSFWPLIYTMETAALIALVKRDDFMKHPKFKELQEMDNLLTPILMDTLIGRQLEQEFQDRWPECIGRATHADQFTKSLVKVKCGPLKTDTVFAVAVLQDIHTVLGEDVSKSWLGMKNFVSECLGRVSCCFHDPPDPADPFLSDKDTHITDGIQQALYFVNDESNRWAFLKDMTPKLQPDESFRMDNDELNYAFTLVNLQESDKTVVEARMRDIASLEQPYILPSRDHKLFWTGNPLACGTMLLNLALATEQAGICLANYHLTIVWTAHLYAAMQHRKLLQGHWQELDKLIQVHLSPLFFGSLPDSPKKFYNTFMMRMGATPSGGSLRQESASPSEVMEVIAQA